MIRTKKAIALGDYAWPICYFESEEEEKKNLDELKASRQFKRHLEQEDNYFNILDELNCESYNHLDIQALNNLNLMINKNANNSTAIQKSVKYPANNFLTDENSLNNNKINVTKLSSLAIVVGWGKKHEKADHYSSYLQKSTLCLIPNKVCELWYKSAGRLMNIHNEMLCAGWRGGGRDACHGDSGYYFFSCFN